MLSFQIFVLIKQLFNNSRKDRIMLKEKNIVLTFCGSKKNPQCPTLIVRKKGISIKDDFGGEVRLTHEQFKELLKKGKDTLKNRIA